MCASDTQRGDNGNGGSSVSFSMASSGLVGCVCVSVCVCVCVCVCVFGVPICGAALTPRRRTRRRGAPSTIDVGGWSLLTLGRPLPLSVTVDVDVDVDVSVNPPPPPPPPVECARRATLGKRKKQFERKFKKKAKRSKFYLFRDYFHPFFFNQTNQTLDVISDTTYFFLLRWMWSLQPFPDVGCKISSFAWIWWSF